MFSLGMTLRRAVQVNGSGLATVFGQRRRTWAELQERVARLAGALATRGVNAGDRVAVLGLNSDRVYEALFAVPWAGGVLVPVNSRLAAVEVAAWLGDSGARVLLVGDEHLPLLSTLRAALPQLTTLVHLGDGPPPGGLLGYEALVASQAPIEDQGRGGDDLAALLFTGGTTGRSKGVMLSHRNLLVNVLQFLAAAPVPADSRLLHVAPMFHIADVLFCLVGASLAATNVILPGFSPAAVCTTIARERVSHALLVPTMVAALLHSPELAGHDLSSLRSVLYGASPMPEAVIAGALELLPQVAFVQGYGQTESAPILSVLPPAEHRPGNPRLRSAGRAAPGVELSVRDEAGRPCAPGVVGEICARGENVMLGYWELPELSAETLRDGWLHTGDGGYLDEHGYLYLVDRIKDMIVSGGENVYSIEVEQVIHAHPAVAECAVIGLPHDELVEQVHAVVRLRPGASLDAEALREHCRQQLAGFKCPRGVTIRSEPLPLSGAGKVLKRQLRDELRR